MKKIYLVIIIHIALLIYVIYDNKTDIIKIILGILPILSSLFFYLLSNIYSLAKFLHGIRERVFPVKFNWTFKVNMKWDDEVVFSKDDLKNFLINLGDQFSITFPSNTNTFKIHSFGRNTEVTFLFNSNSIYFEVYYEAWNSRDFKNNLDNNIGKLFQYISERFLPNSVIYGVNGKCDKYFTNSNIWKLLSDKNAANIDIKFSHFMESEKANLSIARNINEQIYEEINIPTSHNLNKLSDLLEDYITLSLIK